MGKIIYILNLDKTMKYNIKLLKAQHKDKYASFLRFLKNNNIVLTFISAYQTGYMKKTDLFIFLNAHFENYSTNFLSNIIMDGFCWADTYEGCNFWQNIYREAKQIEENK